MASQKGRNSKLYRLRTGFLGDSTMRHLCDNAMCFSTWKRNTKYMTSITDHSSFYIVPAGTVSTAGRIGGSV